MIDNNISNDYFDWLYSLVNKKHHARRSYKKLLSLLHRIEYVYEREFDSKRAAEGEE